MLKPFSIHPGFTARTLELTSAKGQGVSILVIPVKRDCIEGGLLFMRPAHAWSFQAHAERMTKTQTHICPEPITDLVSSSVPMENQCIENGSLRIRPAHARKLQTHAKRITKTLKLTFAQNQSRPCQFECPDVNRDVSRTIHS